MSKRIYTSLVLLLLSMAVYAQITVTLVPSRDNTLFQDTTGSLSDGAGPTFFVGKTNQNLIRRGLLLFDVASVVPAGATITNAVLSLVMTQTTSGATWVTLHTASFAWGEGSSVGSGSGAPAQTNDATWLHTFYPSSFWSHPGGDYTSSSSAGDSVSGVGTYSWNSSQLIANVQSWLNNPSGNFGWVIVGNESTFPTAKSFCSKENSTAASRPTLTITYTPHPPAILNLTAFLQGYYSGQNLMRTTLFDLGLSGDPTATDSIQVNLWDSIHLNNSIPDYSAEAILHKNGTATISYPGANYPGGVAGHSYYIQIVHRDHMETWSAAPVPFTASVSYNFSTGLLKAYNNGFNAPMRNMGSGVFAFWGGDINQDGAIDIQDMSVIDNDASVFLFGYNKSDCTGDGATDASDMSIVDNNAQLQLFRGSPR